MVSIGIQRNGDDQVIGCHMSGHAGYDEHGYDIVYRIYTSMSNTNPLKYAQILTLSYIYNI